MKFVINEMINKSKVSVPKSIYTHTYIIVSSAPMFPRRRTTSAFYIHRARTSTLFVKKGVKMYSVACQL